MVAQDMTTSSLERVWALRPRVCVLGLSGQVEATQARCPGFCPVLQLSMEVILGSLL